MIVWAGMRGAVTVAAAQLLPASTPHRPLLVFVAFAVAASSLVIQGVTVGPLMSRLFAGQRKKSIVPGPEEQQRIDALMERVRAQPTPADGVPEKEYRLRVIRAQRSALLDARDDGQLEAEALARALRNVDIDELVLELRSNEAKA